MQNDGYQQKCDEVRLLREERDIYIKELRLLAAWGPVRRALEDGEAIFNKIPVVEVYEVPTKVPIDYSRCHLMSKEDAY